MDQVNMSRSAYLVGDYRYRLGRRWGVGSSVLFVMFNPSKADALVDDMTITKCIGFATKWGHEAIDVGNLFDYRATDPGELLQVEDPRGPENKTHLWRMISEADRVVLAWGSCLGGKLPRLNVEGAVRKAGKVPLCLGRTKGGYPRHPSRIGYETELEEY